VTLLQMNLVSRADLELVTKLSTGETIFELFLWDEGRFNFKADGVAQGPCDKPVAAEMVLLDALRMRDEWVAIQRGLPDLAVVVAPTVEIESFRQKRAAIEAESSVPGADLEKLFTFANGRIAARRVIDLSRLGTFQGARGLLALMRGGVLRAEERGVAAEPVRREARGRRSSPSRPCACAVLASRCCRAPSRARPRRSAAIRWRSSRRGRDRPPASRARGAPLASGGYPTRSRPPPSTRLAAIPLDRYSYARSSDGGFTLWRVRP
jgi:hypothetical protein